MKAAAMVEEKTRDSKDALTFLFVVSFGLVCLFIYLIYLSSQSNDYVLWCVNKDGVEHSISFRGMDEYDISAIDTCNRKMFEPVSFYVVAADNPKIVLYEGH